MSESELLATYFAAVGAVDASFEFWLSITIALLLTFHFVGAKLSNFLRRVLLILYTFTAVLFLIRTSNAGISVGDIVELLQAANSQVNVRAIADNRLVGVAYILIMIGGTIASIYYGIRSKPSSIPDSETKST